MAKYEYIIVRVNQTKERTELDTLNNYGKEGWEHTSTIFHDQQLFHYYKRKINPIKTCLNQFLKATRMASPNRK